MKSLKFGMIMVIGALLISTSSAVVQGDDGEEGGEEGEESNVTLSLSDTFDGTRNGVRLILSYDSDNSTFTGTVENITNQDICSVRVEVHLDNGTELGPTERLDFGPGASANVRLVASGEEFTKWSAHPETSRCNGETQEGHEGEGSEGGEGSGEHGSGSSEGRGSEGAESSEAAMSSPIIPLGQSWNGILGGLSISARYDATTKSVYTTAKNTLSEKLCFVQAEPHLKLGRRTVGELGPDKMGDLNSGGQATSKLSVANEPELANVVYDGFVIHMEVFDCAGSGPLPHSSSEGSEGSEENHEDNGDSEHD